MTGYAVHTGTEWVRASASIYTDGEWVALAGGAGLRTHEQIIAAIRPPAVATITVGPGKQYATMTAAVPAAVALQAGSGNRIDIIVSPGIYHESIPGSGGVNIIGETGRPEDVAFVANVVDTYRPLGDCYVQGITLKTVTKFDGTTGAKYPLHPLSKGRQVFANCIFDAQNTLSLGSGAAMGQDGTGGTYTLFYDCELRAIPGATWAANMHGDATATKPLTLVYVNCRTNLTVSYGGMNTGQPDEFWWIDSTGPAPTISGTGATLYTEGLWPLP